MKTLPKKLLTKYLPIPAAVLLSFNASAETRINGFANFVAGSTLDSDVTTLDINDNVAYEEDIVFDTDSLFALQISTDLSDKVSATAQILSRGRDDFDANFEWAYISYKATDNLSVNLGRLRAPFFRYSDSADIGFSYHWITAPGTVYDVGFTNLNGARLDYNNYIGDWEYSLQAALGTYESDFAGGELSGNNLVVLTAEATYEWFKIRTVYGRADGTFENPEIDATLDSIEAISPELTEALRVEDDAGFFLGLGLEADFYKWFIAAEFTQVDQTASFVPTDDAFYITAGARIGKFTPSITYEELDGVADNIANQEIVNQFAGTPFFDPLNAVNIGLQTSSSNKESRITAAIRYEFDTSIAIKADVRRIDDDINDNNDVTIVRVAVNYIF
ncbi:topoisomerase IV [Alteromonas sp. 5E99-2]|uniref:topoisomerase IV n=1 Tax=Alteromonas sp. 5E99-2 TaxID=2817683 RepID=UPI001A980A32|nr:topoisomerase IV [Alteromonas sp. 5E99-2]MBO1255982.1 topoisomerase IV [Alteromonas sp. 5E99-2]